MITITMLLLLVADAFFAGIAVMWWLKKEKIIRASTLQSAVEKANEMVTLHSYFQHVVQVREITLKVSESKLLAVCKGEIICKFDMSKSKVIPNVSKENKHVTIKMPSCELRPIIDVNDVEVFDATRGIIDFLWDVVKFENKYDYNKVRDIINQERQKITQEAQEKLHLAEKAKDNARDALKNLAAAFGYTADIIFEDDSSSIFAPEARPVLPAALSTVPIPVVTACKETAD